MKPNQEMTLNMKYVQDALGKKDLEILLQSQIIDQQQEEIKKLQAALLERDGSARKEIE